MWWLGDGLLHIYMYIYTHIIPVLHGCTLCQCMQIVSNTIQFDYFFQTTASCWNATHLLRSPERTVRSDFCNHLIHCSWMLLAYLGIMIYLKHLEPTGLASNTCVYLCVSQNYSGSILVRTCIWPWSLRCGDIDTWSCSWGVSRQNHCTYNIHQYTPTYLHRSLLWVFMLAHRTYVSHTHEELHAVSTPQFGTDLVQQLQTHIEDLLLGLHPECAGSCRMW